MTDLLGSDIRNPAPPGGPGSAPTADAAPAPSASTEESNVRLQAPTLSLPKGGGAIGGIGEKFAAQPFTGTGTMSVPLATSPGRSGFGPQLSLSYDSGSGNGAFGFGWSLGLPTITRKTDKGLPRYLDGEESDVYILSGAEDLVPLLLADGSRFEDSASAPGYVIHRYRPRVEGLFSRIERWTCVATGEIHWQSITRDNVTTLYGTDRDSRIFDSPDPAAPGVTRVFSWLIRTSYDDKGNAIDYEYAAENDANVDRRQAHERNRLRITNRYLKRIKYGNRVSRLVQPDLSRAEWMFEVVFDYDEGHYEEVELDAAVPPGAQHRRVRASPSPTRPWSARPDPFSSYRAGFEIRTYRRCHRVLMFHHIPALPRGEDGYDGLVRSIDFDYRDFDYRASPSIDAELAHQGSTRFGSFIQTVTQSGFVRDATQSPSESAEATYVKKSLPPVELVYSKAIVHDETLDVAPASLEDLPTGVSGPENQLVDLNGEGIAGVLTEQDGTWFYKPNLGAGQFGAFRQITPKPSFTSLRDRTQQLLDLAGDGQLQLVVLGGATPGFYDRTQREGWRPFRPFRELPQIAWDDPNLRFADLDGDGLADVLITEQDNFAWYRSLSRDGFAPRHQVAQPLDEDRGPRLILGDGTQSVYLADMSGDGLADLVRIRNGEVCYWPNRGYGHFGAKITLDNAPWFDAPDRFDQGRIRLADIDGSGTTDIVYVAGDGPRLYFNQSGNRLGDARRLSCFPAVNSAAEVTVADLLGTGTACLVWSSSLPGDAGRQLRYVDLMGSNKPHLLVETTNNLGLRTAISYATSTKFYLADKRRGRPWVTRLPFPVHVVERVVTDDAISRTRVVTRYSYHHGYFDGVEREFRGFGMVEQWDTEALEVFTHDRPPPPDPDPAVALHLPPILTRTWFHTGALLEESTDRYMAHEYYNEPGLSAREARMRTLDETAIPSGLTGDERREACRALKASMLRQEVYAIDGTVRESHPYTVTEQNFTIRLLQPRLQNRYAVFLTHTREALNLHYEREPADPRMAHTLTLQVDDYGNVHRSASVNYGRRRPELDLPEAVRDAQARTLITYMENRVTNAIEVTSDYRAPLPCESRTYELTGLSCPTPPARFTFETVRDAGTRAAFLPYEQQPAPGHLQKRLLECVRTLYRRNDLTGPLPLGHLQSLALPFDTYRLAFTNGLIATLYGGRVDDRMVADDCRYVHLDDDDWWAPSGKVFYSSGTDDPPSTELTVAREHFFRARRYRDPFFSVASDTDVMVTFDPFDLLLVETRDPLGNVMTAVTADDAGVTEVRLDYRTLQPYWVTDPNGNRSQAAFDAIGMVVGTAVMGKANPARREGDSLEGFIADLPDAVIRDHLRHPLADPHAILGMATTRLVYDLFAYRRTRANRDPQPVATYTLTRETHAADLKPREQTRIQHSFAYSDGFGRDIQKKGQAEPDPAARPSPPDDAPPTTAPGRLPTAKARWVGSGWTVFNNKNKPVRKFEPFFSDTHLFEFDARKGVSALLFYDPAQRVVATLHPDHTVEKVVFTPWRQVVWDVNDMVLLEDPRADPDVGDFFRRLPEEEYLPSWYAQRKDGQLGRAQQLAAAKAAVHAATPTSSHFDTQGRSVLRVVHNRRRAPDDLPGPRYIDTFRHSRITYDIEGNQREIFDAKDRAVARFAYDVLARQLHQASMEAGERWILPAADDKPAYRWDSRDHRFRLLHDRLRRPSAVYVRTTGGGEALVTRTVYGETHPQAEASNLRGRPVTGYDQAGVLTTDRYDFKGNLIRSQRQFAENYRDTVDWSSESVPLREGVFTTNVTHDALNRVTKLTTPDGSQTRSHYNEAGLLAGITCLLRAAQSSGQLVPTTFVREIVYDAKAQRTRIDYGNDVVTRYEYDPLTFRLTRLHTRRPPVRFPEDCPRHPPPEWPGCDVQDLRYTYDPIGNITEIHDRAQQVLFFRNRRVAPNAQYTYDAAYRLIAATGREHLGQRGEPAPYAYDDACSRTLRPSDGKAMARYRERYAYDEAGNLLAVRHRGADPEQPGWARTFSYDEPSQLEPWQVSNRVTSSEVAGTVETYSVGGDGYDAAGNMLHLPHLPVMAWDFDDQLRLSQRQRITDAEPPVNGERTWYVYDAKGTRARKVTESQRGSVRDDRLYLGTFELYARHGNQPVERETLHIIDASKRIALVETRTAGKDKTPPQLTRYQISNHLGSSSIELDGSAGIISYEEYSPYGSTTCQAVSRSIRAARKRYRFTGQERDEETGFTIHGVRYYAAWLGRWTSADPSGVQNGLNAYEYVESNPVGGVDLTGSYTISWKHVAIGAGFALGALAIGAAVVATGGLAAGPIAVALGSTAATGEAVFGAAVLTAGAVGAVDTAKTVGEIASGKEFGTNRDLTDEEASLKIGGAAVGIIAAAVGLKGIKGNGPPAGLGELATAALEGGGPKFSFAGGPAPPSPISLPVTVSPTTQAIAVGLGVKPLLMAAAGSGSGKGSGDPAEPPPRGKANRERKISRDVAERGLREALETEKLTPRQLEQVQLIEAQYGKEAIAEFRETGVLPRGVENSHPYSVQSEPELASRPGDLVPRPFHRYGVHPGDTSIPLEGDPLASDYAEQSGFTLLDENGTPIGQAGTEEVDQGVLNMCTTKR